MVFITVLCLQTVEQRFRGAPGVPACSEGFGCLCRCHLRQAVRGVFYWTGGQLWEQTRHTSYPHLPPVGLHGVCGGHRHQMYVTAC